MGFKTDMGLAQYEPEMGSGPLTPVPGDVQRGHGKITRGDAVHAGPVERRPAKLKG